MGALRQSKGVPTFTTYTEVEVDIEPEDLERAGWVFVGKDDAPGASTETALEVVRIWHDDTHAGPWQWCQEQPCDTLRGRPSGLQR